MAASGNYKAGGDINPSRLVVRNGDSFTVTQGADNSASFAGVSQEGTRQPPGVTGSSALAASSGEPLHVYGDGEECLLTLSGASSVTYNQGDLIGSDSVGMGEKITPANDDSGVVYYAGVLQEDGVGGEKRRFLVQPGIYVNYNAA